MSARLLSLKFIYQVMPNRVQHISNKGLLVRQKPLVAFLKEVKPPIKLGTRETCSVRVHVSKKKLYYMDTYKSKLSDVLGTQYISPPAIGSSHINVGDTERIASLVGGALLAYYGLRKPNAGGLAMAAAGGAMVYRGATGYCPINEMLGRDSSSGRDISLEITRSLTIRRPRREVYQFWRQLENLPQFMKHLQEVRQLGPKQSHWVARVPKGVGTVEWNADIVQEETDSLISWRSLAGSDVDNAGEVRFSDAPAKRGTVVQATISYRPPAGAVGGSVAKLLNPAFQQMVENDLRRFKQIMETGEVITTEGQPAGKR